MGQMSVATTAAPLPLCLGHKGVLPLDSFLRSFLLWASEANEELSQGKSHWQHHFECYCSLLNRKEMIISVNFLLNFAWRCVQWVPPCQAGRFVGSQRVRGMEGTKQQGDCQVTANCWTGCPKRPQTHSWPTFRGMAQEWHSSLAWDTWVPGVGKKAKVEERRSGSWR